MQELLHLTLKNAICNMQNLQPQLICSPCPFSVSSNTAGYQLVKGNSREIERNILFFLYYRANDAVQSAESMSDNIFAISFFISQMGFGSQGHTSWKTDGLRRHQGHCGHNETAYVCSFTVLPPPLSSRLLQPPSASAG